MSLEIGNYIDDLVQTNPTGGDDFKQGDDHLRLIKIVLKNTFPFAGKAFRFPSAALAATSSPVNIAFPTDQNKIFPVNATGGAITVNLPDPTSGATVNEDGFSVTVIKSDASANAVTITPSGAHTITGQANLILTQQFDLAWLVWDKLDARWYALQPPRGASEVVQGVVERATDAEAAAGSDTTRYISPAQLHEARADVASAATVDLGAVASNFVRITGTTTITSLGSAAAGVWRDVTFAAALILTHHATNLIIPGGANITTAANDRMLARSLGSGTWIILHYTKASGLATVVAATTTPHLLTVIAEDQQSSGVAGGSFASGVNTRTLNTLVFNRGSLASLGSNRLTLPAGTWFIKWWAPVGGSINGFLHQSYLYNQSDSAEVKRGTSGHIDTGTQTDAINYVSVGSAVVTIASSKDFEIRHDTNQAAGNQGPAASLGTEVYTRVEVWSVP